MTWRTSSRKALPLQNALNLRPLYSGTSYISRPYLAINWVFAFIFTAIVVYSALYDPDQNNYPLPSAYQVLTGGETISTGLSRSFSALVRFRFEDAREYNSYGMRLFLFFVVQLMLRLILLILILRGTLHTGKILILADTAQSIVMFTGCFWPFLVYWMNLLGAG